MGWEGFERASEGGRLGSRDLTRLFGSLFRSLAASLCSSSCSPLITSVAHAIFSHIRASEPLFPFSHLWKNVPKGDESDQLASFPVPDVVPGLVAVSELGNGNTLSPILITQGDFSRIYSTTEKIEKYDAVVANFFIDKAGGGDTLLALEQVAAPLKRGGVLLVAGPLDWKSGFGEARVG